MVGRHLNLHWVTLGRKQKTSKALEDLEELTTGSASTPLALSLSLEISGASLYIKERAILSRFIDPHDKINV
jgi:hypothetical protein